MPAAPRFNVPPGWPIPQGWAPPPGWIPDPAWPPAPPGWRFWADGVAEAAPYGSSVGEYPSSSTYFATDGQTAAVHPRPGWTTQPAVPPSAAAGAGMPPPAQAAVSAALILPSLLDYYLVYDGMDGPYWLSSVVIALLEIYLAVVVAVWSRTPQRRVTAVALVLTGLVVDRGAEALNMNVFDEYSQGLFAAAWIAMVLLFVAAWCVARRTMWISAAGLVPTLGLAALAAWFYSSGHALGWLQIWAIDVGVFVAGCLMCWGLEVLVRGQAGTDS
jgi:hypothetical protein